MLVPVPSMGADMLRVEGRVLNGTSGRPPGSGIRVEIAVVGSDGGRIDGARTALNDKGRFSSAVEFQPGARTVVSARFEGVTYSTIARAGTSVARADLRVFETTRDPGVVTVDADTTVLQPATSGDLEVLRIVRMTNNSNRTFIGQSGDTASFRLPLPDGAFSVRVVNGLTPGRARPADGTLEAGDPLQPGDATFTYAYKLRGDEGEWAVAGRSIYATERADVLIEPEYELGGGSFRLLDDIDFAGDTYRQYVRNNVASGERISFAVSAGSGVGVWPIAAGAGALLVLLVLAWRVGRARSGRRRSPSHDEVITAIAALDLAHETGDLEEAEYTARRTVLKDRLERTPR
jgi:hypothetical protein